MARDLVVLMLLSTALTLASLSADAQCLYPGFYGSRCPNLESIVRSVAEQRFKQLLNHPAQMIRLFFHDCFVKGCDGSILISSTSRNLAEKDANISLSLSSNAFKTVEIAKAAVESECPGVVSCADILVLLTRDLLTKAGGPWWNVALGRRDARLSHAKNTRVLPLPDDDIQELIRKFRSMGLTTVDLVALSGAHTMGVSHCTAFTRRLYNFSTASTTDPSMDPKFAKLLRKDCPRHSSPNSIEMFEHSAPFTFDNNYFKDLETGRGLLASDQELYSSSSSTRTLVDSFAKNAPLFFRTFATSMNKLSRIGVNTGKKGEIRRNCSCIN